MGAARDRATLDLSAHVRSSQFREWRLSGSYVEASLVSVRWGQIHTPRTH
jgi:hypothetical protein